MIFRVDVKEPSRMRGNSSRYDISEPEVRILGGPDMYVDTGSIINLTCVVKWTPGPPQERLS